MTDKLHVIMVGTDPSSRRGGIATALPGYFYALQLTDISFDFIPSHHATAWGGKWRYWLASFVLVAQSIRAARCLNKQTILYFHVGGGFVSFARKGILAVFVRFMKCPVVMQMHSAVIANSYLTTPARRFFFRMAVSPASAISVLTPWWKDLLIVLGISKPLFIVPNPLEKQWWEIACTPIVRAASKNKLMILSMTRIEAGKGVDLLIEALPQLPDNIQTVVAGDGALLPTIKARAAELGLMQRVVFTGWVDGEEKLNLLRKADLFCLPSSNDSFGMGFIEAMAHGLPVVALDWGPIHDVVPNGECGILIKQADPEQLVQAIKKLASDGDMRNRMGCNAQRWVRKKFSVEAIGKEIRKMMEVMSL